jgi:hypothetical protein
MNPLGHQAYSPDVEIDHRGIVVAVRDLQRGDPVEVPIHIFARIVAQSKLPRL